MNKKLTKTIALACLSFSLIFSGVALAQTNEVIKPDTKEQTNKKTTISGVVVDNKGNRIVGATVVVTGTSLGVLTDIDGRFSITASVGSELMISFIGYKTQKVRFEAKSPYNIILTEDVEDIDAVIVVGYGTQKKSTLIGAVTQTGNKEIQRTGGVTNLAQTFTGNLPGVTTIQNQGQPGASDPQIFIRGRATWNNTSPYVLVDGVERRMNDIDVNEVETISVLKDASATAVYGVKGANGVILISTKRGSLGKPVISVSANTTMKVSSQLMDKLDAYDAITIKDASIAKESVLNPASWKDFVPYAIRDRYRNQVNLRYPEAYPNVDWQDLLMNDFSMDYRVNLSASGGNNIVKYFTSASYLHEGDMLNSRTDYYGKDWKPGYNNNRFNFRSNVDINITKSTTLSVNLAAIYTEKQQPAESQSNFNGMILNALYTTPSNIYMPVYANGLWGENPSAGNGYYNPLQFLITQGYSKYSNTNMTSDFVVNQKLDFVTKGLSVMGKFSFDNIFSSKQTSSPGYRLNGYYINPGIEDASYLPDFNANDYIVERDLSNIPYYDTPLSPWKLGNEENNASQTLRRIYYQVQANYARAFGKHNVGATGVFTREEMAKGSEFMNYREDWIFRVTYNYDSRYLIEVNGAYNGSEKFARGKRFEFFPSVGLGWAVSNEKFLKDQKWLDMLKLRYSTGKIGDDNINGRWLYMSQYRTNNAITGMNDQYYQKSPYALYQQSSIGYPDISWETAQKTNYGIDVSVFQGLLTCSFDYFTEKRTDILINGGSRVLPFYYSFYMPTANLGKVDKKGYEFVLSMRKRINDSWNVWGNFSVTHAKDKVIYREEPRLRDPHLLKQGFPLNQVKVPISDGFMENWDEIYSSPIYANNDHTKLPGDFRVIDFDADGIYDANTDIAPYGYSDIPENTYSGTLGFEYKGLSFMVQFYGVNNVTRNVSRNNFDQGFDLAYAHAQDYWSPEHTKGKSFLPRYKAAGNMVANYYQVDGSYVRLKNAEISYTFNKNMLKKVGLDGLRLYINGNNLFFWSKELPDDRETGSGLAYPNMKRFNLGVDIKF